MNDEERLERILIKPSCYILLYYHLKSSKRINVGQKLIRVAFAIVAYRRIRIDPIN